MARKPVSPEEAQAKLCAINARQRALWTDESFFTTPDGRVHEGQKALLASTAERILVASTARSGKTFPILKCGADTCLDTPNVVFLYIAITADQAKRVAWRPWKSMLRKAGIACEHTELSTSFPNGSVAYFCGADDLAQITVFLGMSLAGGLVVIDECAERDAIMEELVEDIISDRLTDITEDRPTPGRLICISSLPRTKGGWFYRKIDEAQKGGTEYELHTYSRLDNPFLKNQREMFDKWLARRHLTEDDPLARRMWKAELVYDIDAGKPYRYREDVNAYDPDRPKWADEIVVRSGRILAAALMTGITEVLVALDLGGSDRASIQALGFGPSTPVLQHVFDWTSERDQFFSWGELLPILQLVSKHLPVVGMFYDAGADGTAHDEFGKMYGIPLIAAANKRGMEVQTMRTSELLMQGRIKVMRDSAVAGDFTRAQWDRRELLRGKKKLAIGPFKVDASEAFRYCIAAYNDGWKPPRQPLTQAQMLQLLIDQPPPAPAYGYQDDPGLARMLGGSSSDSYGPPD